MNATALYARKVQGFDQRHAQALALLRQAACEHAGRLVQASSLGAEDMVLTDMIVRHRLELPVGTLDTGALHEQTMALVSRIQEHYGLSVEVYRPQAEAVIQFVKTNGERAMYDSIDLRKACCGIRKLEPLSRLLEGRTAWVTGLRREQSNNRSEVPLKAMDNEGRTKWSPLAGWSWADVWHYIATHHVPYNPLHDEFMPSIGCAPCTRAIAVGEDFRAGRWWWENEDAKECGLHKTYLDAPASSAGRNRERGDLVSAQVHIGSSEYQGSNASGHSQAEKAKKCSLQVHGAEELARPTKGNCQ
jgi:phosphoadenosine phosphosulfate reductase